MTCEEAFFITPADKGKKIRGGKNKKGTLSLICGVQYSSWNWKRLRNKIDPPILGKNFCLYTSILRQSFFLFAPQWDKVFAFLHPYWDKVLQALQKALQKTVLYGKSKKVPPQQQPEQRFPLPDLSAAPQIKREKKMPLSARKEEGIRCTWRDNLHFYLFFGQKECCCFGEFPRCFVRRRDYYAR